MCSSTSSLKSSKTKQNLILTREHLPATSLLTGDGLTSASMHYKQNNITVCVAVGTDTHWSLCRRVGCTLIHLIYGVVSYCTHRVKGEGVVHDSAGWALKVPREWGRDRGCCGGRAEGMIRARSRPQAAGAGGGSPPPLRPRHLAQNGRKHEHKFNFTLPPQFLYVITIALTFHIVVIVAHVGILCEQSGAGGGGDAPTDPLHAHLLLQALDPAWALQTDVNHFAKDLHCCRGTMEHKREH